MRANPPGFHTTLTPNLHDEIIANVKKVITPTQVARLSKIPQPTLWHWLNRGFREVKDNKNTIYSQLAIDFDHALAELIEELIEKLRSGNRSWQAHHELLKVAAKEDFGGNAIEFKELVEKYQVLYQSYKKLVDNPIQVPQLEVTDHGGKVDTESD